MLLKEPVFRGIKEGKIDLVFRRWRKPTVKKGGTLTHAWGVLSIEAVDVVELDEITGEQARRAGYANRSELVEELKGYKADEDIYRVRVVYRGEDPRIALRESDTLDAAELEAIDRKLDGYDQRSSHGAWTKEVLALIKKYPARRAPELAEMRGLETQVFKTDVRKLKALGLTESLEVGYRISPRGLAYLKATRR